MKEAAPDEKELKKMEKNVQNYKSSFEKTQKKANEKEEQVHM